MLFCSPIVRAVAASSGLLIHVTSNQDSVRVKLINLNFAVVIWLETKGYHYRCADVFDAERFRHA
jgi:hypothetical protein